MSVLSKQNQTQPTTESKKSLSRSGILETMVLLVLGAAIGVGLIILLLPE